MRAYLQWTLATPADWVPLDITRTADWRGLPKKAEPVGGEVIDQTPGWVYDLNVQGVLMGGFDHYSVTPSGAGLRVTVWNDDPVDYPVGTRWAMTWTLQLPTLDARIGRVNTRQTLVVHDEAVPSRWEGKAASGGPVTVLPWSSFVAPAANMTRHGIWVPEAEKPAYIAARTSRGWEEWTGG